MTTFINWLPTCIIAGMLVVFWRMIASMLSDHKSTMSQQIAIMKGMSDEQHQEVLQRVNRHAARIDKTEESKMDEKYHAAICSQQFAQMSLSVQDRISIEMKEVRTEMKEVRTEIKKLADDSTASTKLLGDSMFDALRGIEKEIRDLNGKKG